MNDLTFNVYVFTNQRPAEAKRTTDEEILGAVSLVMLRAKLIETSARVLQSAGRTYTIPDITSAIATRKLFAVHANPNDLLLAQADFFGKFGIRSIEAPFNPGIIWTIDGGEIEFRIKRVGTITGSRRDEYVVDIKVRIKGKVGRSLLRLFLIGSLSGVAGPIADRIQPDFIPAGVETTYVCTINGYATGNQIKLIGLAASDLKMPLSPNKSITAQVMKARQMCLMSAGFDPGPLDGKDGRLTEQAAVAFAQFYGIAVNWNSDIFLQLLTEEAMKHQQFRRR